MFNLDSAIENIQGREVYKLMENKLIAHYIDFDDVFKQIELAELYKIVSPSSLIHSLNEDVSEYEVVSMDREYVSNKFSSLYNKLHELGFFIYYYDESGRTVTLATSMDNIDNSVVDLMFGDLKVEKVALTPLNYMKISNPSEVDKVLVPSILFFRLIAEGYIRKATDVKVSCFALDNKRKVYEIRFRIGNELLPSNLFNLTESINKRMIEELLTEESIFGISQASEASGVKFSIHNPFVGVNMTLRVAIGLSEGGFSSNTRIIKTRSLDNSSNSLGFPEKVSAILDSMTRVTTGLCLVTGPMRSGKTTTLLAVLSKICEKPLGVIEISDPVESPLALDAFSYKNENGLVDTTGLMKKMDVDIALVNEVPTRVVADAIYDLVNSSVGVFTTMHINRIWHICYKLQEYFGDKLINVISYMRYLVNQKSFIKQCPHCRETVTFEKNSSDLYPEVKELCIELGIKSYMQSKGCDKCEGKGTQAGIQPYVEYLVFTDKFKSDLCKCSGLYEMECLIREKVKLDETSLEYFVMDGIRSGDLHPNELINLL